MTENEIPLDQLADEDDELDWDIERDGRMRNFVEVPVETILWTEGLDA